MMKVLPGMVVTALLVGYGLAPSTEGQSRGNVPAPPMSSPMQTNPDMGMPPMGPGREGESMAVRMEAQQVKSRNSDRQKRIQTDTEKLLVLATDLKEQVAKTDKNILSVDVIKKADEIEKLAHSVKERMKG